VHKPCSTEHGGERGGVLQPAEQLAPEQLAPEQLAPEQLVAGRRTRRTGRAPLPVVAALMVTGALLAPRATLAQESAPPSAAVPVSVATVTRQDVPLWLRGLGTVQAFYSVQLRTQVDGTLLQVPVTEGQEVKQGDLLAVIDPKPYQAALDAAAAKKQQDQADLVNAKQDLARYTSLARQDFASRQQVDTQITLVNHLGAAIAGDDAQIEAARLNLGYSSITAPFAGRVGLRTVDPGNFVRAAEATSLMPLSQIRPIAVTFTVPQDALPAVQDALRKGAPPVEAYSSDDTTELDRGTLLTVDNAIDSTTGTIKLKATFPNAASHLWPGQFVNTRLLLGTATGVLTVPSQAVLHGQDRLYAYVVNPDRTASVQTVQIKRDDGTLAIITQGLTEGQLVVTDGQSRLVAGRHVTVVAGAPKKPAGSPQTGG
jgi:multidrug efflux system membrane fusion protein